MGMTTQLSQTTRRPNNECQPKREETSANMSSEIVAVHRCPVCYKTYKRREHLQRHRASHTSERPHRCILCSASFQRTDVLKRHIQTCDGMPHGSSGRRRACDRCVRQKKACNSAQPCQNCAKRAVQCLYSSVASSTGQDGETAGTSASNSVENFPIVSNTQQQQQQQTRQYQHQQPLPQQPQQQQHQQPVFVQQQHQHQQQLHHQQHSPQRPRLQQLQPQLHQQQQQVYQQQHAQQQHQQHNIIQVQVTQPLTQIPQIASPVPVSQLPHIPQVQVPQMLQQSHQSHPSHPAHQPHHAPFGHPGVVHFDDLDNLLHDAAGQFPMFEQNDISIPDWLEIGLPIGAPPTDTPEATTTPRSSPSSESHRGYSFHFLYDFTSRTGLLNSFECGSYAQRRAVVDAFYASYTEQQKQHQRLQQMQQHQQHLQQQQQIHEQVEFHPMVSQLQNPMGQAPLSPASSSTVSTSATSNDYGYMPWTLWSSWLSNPIIIKLQEIVVSIMNVVRHKPSNSSLGTLTWTPEKEQECLQFFSPQRFAKYIELYWSCWHSNINFLHRPSFDPTSAKPVLLAAMVIIGATVSPDEQDVKDAKVWFNCVEEMAFNDDDFCNDNEPNSPADDDSNPPSVLHCKRKLQALQAAYIVCIYQNFEGSDPSKRRIRRHRFNTVVSVARDIGIPMAKHLEYGSQLKHEFDWNEYVVREELIRTFLWIFLLDAAFVIFNNLPHRMVIKEMRMHMASPEAVFQAPDAEKCLEEIYRWMPSPSPICNTLLRDVLQNIIGTTLEADMLQRLAQLGPLNLFVVVSVFHYMIFQHQNLYGVEGHLVPIRTGLENWITIWELWFDNWSTAPPHCMADLDNLTPENMWKRIGFIRCSAEYWLLGNLLTDRMGRKTSGGVRDNQGKGSSPDSYPDDMPVSGGGKSAEPILGKYDQTSMRQVNELISDFQKIQIEENQ
ncbi:hypothetical protein QBC45DRAFT_18517 [Copromyces sp. CBS 386.78]|nr:hypothetical protein QBC45DRAFT_18517 [Copromyces sp. CBS 386.78]